MNTGFSSTPAPTLTTPWYRQPMVLLVVGIPALAVVVSFTMLAISVKTFDGVVVDDYYRHGKEINQTLQRDDAAISLGISAKVEFNRRSAIVRLNRQDPSRSSETLTLRILHPTRRNHDIVVNLKRQQLRQYGALLPHVVTGERIIQIETETWRLSGRTNLKDGLSLTLGNNGQIIR